MNRQRKARLIEPIKNYSEVWQLHQNIGQLAGNLDRLPDSAEIRKRKRKSAPLNLTDMVF